jgi:hypothetical protein
MCLYRKCFRWIYRFQYMKTDRRTFIKTFSIASASLSPVVKTLSGTLGIEAGQLDSLGGYGDDLNELSIIDNNLLNLQLFFINIDRKDNKLAPPIGKRSFMIVRLPQLHVPEKGFWNTSWNDNRKFPDGSLSGYSFLAFQLWADVGPDNDMYTPLPFKLPYLLDWNNTDVFKLVTLVEWLDLKKINESDLVFRDIFQPEFGQHKVWNPKSADNQVYQKGDNEPASKIYGKFKSIILKLLNGNLSHPDNDFVPCSFLNIDNGFCLLPISPIRNKQGGIQALDAIFNDNAFVNQSKSPKGNRRYPIWYNQLAFQYTNPSSATGPDEKYQVVLPHLRAMGMITDYPAPDILKIKCEQFTSGERDTIPTLLDKYELAYLTQYAKGNAAGQDFTLDSFDIKVIDGMFFTGLGIITHIKYANLEHCPPGIDLIEYEHIINEGRDIFIKVARLGYNSKTGQRYKHVIEGKRRINSAYDNNKNNTKQPLASFVELKQYCECIEKQISYIDDEVYNPNWSANFIVNTSFATNDITAPTATNTPDYKRNIFTSLEVNEPKRVPIMAMQGNIVNNNPCTLEGTDWFWPILENAGKEGDSDLTIPLTSYYFCEFAAKDWEGQLISKKTPFMFIRKSAIEKGDTDAAYNNYYKSAPLPAGQIYIDRRKIFFENQPVAFTPSLDKDNVDQLKMFTQREEQSGLKAFSDIKATLKASMDKPGGSRNKVNILETEFADYYFHVRKNFDVANIMNVKYVILPQILRAQVYIDHIRDLTQQKISSVVQYHPDYISAKFDDYKKDADGLKGNAVKSILVNTDAFLKKVEEPLNNTYQYISQALQQSKKYLGNLNIPDIVPDTISLDKLGITAPPDVKGAIAKGTAVLSGADGALQKIAAFNPRELLRGKLSDICGLDLTALLDQFLPLDDDNGQNHTPLFQINKVLNQVTDDVKQSQVYQEYKEQLDKVQQNIDNYEKAYQNAAKSLNEQRTQLNADLKLLSDSIPNQYQLNDLVKNLYEVGKTKAFQFVATSPAFETTVDTLATYKLSIDTFLTNETALLNEEYLSKRQQLNDTVNSYQKDINQLEAGLSRDFTTIVNQLLALYTPEIADYLATADLLYHSCLNADLYALPGVFYLAASDVHAVVLSTTAIPGSAPLQVCKISYDGRKFNVGLIQFIQLRDALTAIILNNINGKADQVNAALSVQTYLNTLLTQKYSVNGNQVTVGDFLIASSTALQNGQNGIAATKLLLNNWKTAADGVIADPATSIAVKTAATHIRDVAVKLTDYLDLLKRVDPYYYYQRLDTLLKQVQDTKNRFTQAFFDLYGRITTFINTWVDNYTQLTANAAKVVSDINNLRASLATNPNDQNLKDRITQKLKDLAPIKQQLIDLSRDSNTLLNTKVVSIVNDYLKSLPARNPISQAFKDIYDETDGLVTKIAATTKTYQQNLQVYSDYIKAEGSKAEEDITTYVGEFMAKHADDLDLLNQARNVYNILTSIKQQDLSYTWKTNKFSDVNLGIINFKKFTGPDTTLKIDVRSTIYFSQGKFPPAIERVSVYTENRFTDFGLTVFDILTLNFSEISFIDGSDHPRQFNVKIKDVKFDGALSFVQAFESWLKTMGKGLILQLQADHVALGYSIALPAIKTPGFNFFNLSLNFDLRLYYDNRPLRFGFSLATPDSKFGLAVGIYAGFGFFGIVADPKHGIVEIDCALEGGAWAGISIGPISGEVKLAFGFRYTKTETYVRIEGYIVAEGRLTVWILEVSARIYLGIVSQNSYVEGVCTVSYEVKLGFIHKSFSGSFHRKIAGAAAQNQGENHGEMENFASKLLMMPMGEMLTQKLKPHLSRTMSSAQLEEVTETAPVNLENWSKFINIF